MAIYIGIDLVDEDEDTKYFAFSNSEGIQYGLLAVNTNTLEITMVESKHVGAKSFAFPRACKAIKKAAREGEIPDSFYYAA